MNGKIDIGTTKLNGIKIAFDALNPGTNNHTLILGESGTGKTYFTQILLKGFIEQGYKTCVLDLAGSISKNQAEPWFFKDIDEDVLYFNVSQKGTGLNLFKRVQMDEETMENAPQMALRVTDILSFYIGRGEVQRSILYECIKKMAEKSELLGRKASLYTVQKELMNIEEDDEAAGKMARKLAPLIDCRYFSENEEDIMERQELLKIWEMQSVPMTIKKMISEIILWQLWGAAVIHGSRENPMFILIDEFQNLNINQKSPVYKILCEGRKYGLNLILATQFYKGKFSPEVEMAVAQMGNKVFFKPPEREAGVIAEMLAIDEEKKQLERELKQLKRGYAKVRGNYYMEKESYIRLKGPKTVKIRTVRDSRM